MKRRFGTVFLSCSLGLVACGGGKAPDAQSPKKGSEPAAASDAGEPVSDAGAGAVDPKPFAGSAAEATQLVSAAVDSRRSEIARCVDDYRTRKKVAHKRVQLQVGIDQDGNLLGVALPKNQKDNQLSACVQEALKNTVFPRSHAGVITITKSYEEIIE